MAVCHRRNKWSAVHPTGESAHEWRSQLFVLRLLVLVLYGLQQLLFTTCYTLNEAHAATVVTERSIAPVHLNMMSSIVAAFSGLCCRATWCLCSRNSVGAKSPKHCRPCASDANERPACAVRLRGSRRSHGKGEHTQTRTQTYACAAHATTHAHNALKVCRKAQATQHTPASEGKELAHRGRVTTQCVIGC